MKKLLLAIVLLTSTAIAFAGPNNNQTLVAAEKNVSASIKSQISMPECLADRVGEHSAAIFFAVTDCGAIKVSDIKCDEEDLKAALLNQAEGIKVNTSGLDSRDTYKVVVRFQIL
jgi:hypothetical protein